MSETTSGNILGTLRTFFGYKTLGEFAADWKKLTDEDKAQLREGVLDGSFTY